MIIYDGKKSTATSVAKQIFWMYGASWSCDFDELGIETDLLTERESAALLAALQKQEARVKKFLGV